MGGSNRRNSSVALLSAAAATGAGPLHSPWGEKQTYQALGRTSSGSGSATIDIEVSDVDAPSAATDWITAGTITLTLGTTDVSDGFALDAAWRHVRANITALSGTGATVDVWMGG